MCLRGLQVHHQAYSAIRPFDFLLPKLSTLKLSNQSFSDKLINLQNKLIFLSEVSK